MHDEMPPWWALALVFLLMGAGVGGMFYGVEKSKKKNFDRITRSIGECVQDEPWLTTWKIKQKGRAKYHIVVVKRGDESPEEEQIGHAIKIAGVGNWREVDCPITDRIQEY